MDALDMKKTDTVNTMNDGAEKVAVGSVEEVKAYTPRTFYRSVLFQMVLFGM
jgi:hypothetical protein